MIILAVIMSSGTCFANLIAALVARVNMVNSNDKLVEA